MGGERRLAEAGINDGGGGLKTQGGPGDAVLPREKLSAGDKQGLRSPRRTVHPAGMEPR